MPAHAGALRIREARPDDVRAIARLFALAGQGLPEYLWAQEAGVGETPIDVGARHAAREDASYSWRNADLAELDGQVAGLMLGYPVTGPSADARVMLPRVPAVMQPLMELEFEAPRSFYINALAVFARARGRGIGARLVATAGQRAIAHGLPRVCVQVFEHNVAALRLYRRAGFELVDRRALPADSFLRDSGDTLLLQRPVSRS